MAAGSLFDSFKGHASWVISKVTKSAYTLILTVFSKRCLLWLRPHRNILILLRRIAWKLSTTHPLIYWITISSIFAINLISSSNAAHSLSYTASSWLQQNYNEYIGLSTPPQASQTLQALQDNCKCCRFNGFSGSLYSSRASLTATYHVKSFGFPPVHGLSIADHTTI